MKVGNVNRFLFVKRSSNSNPGMRDLSTNFNLMGFRTSVKCYEPNRVPVVGQQGKANRVESNYAGQKTAQALQDSLQVRLGCDGAGPFKQRPIPAVRCAF